jgi:DNA-binding MarR family transcriptional regulator
MAKHLQDCGITVSQYATLSVIQNVSPITGAALARETFVTPQTMHALLISLEGKRFIERTVKDGNAKSLDICLTPEGAIVLSKAAHKIDWIIEQSESIFSEREIDLMKRHLALYENRLDELS